MKVLIAPDSFKGSVSSLEAAESISHGIKEIDKEAELKIIPIADGGEGTTEAIIAGTGGEIIKCQAQNPFGKTIDSYYGWISDNKTAVIEMAAASGIIHLSNMELNPHKASTYGTGELIKHCIDKGAKVIIIGIGGSATVDGGVGCLNALGVKFYDDNNAILDNIGGELGKISKIDISNMDKRLFEIKIIVACDVTNPLLGEKGAIRVFGRQKGVKEEEIESFENGMEKFARLSENLTGKYMRNEPGTGAAGGLGFALKTFLNAEIKNGLELIAELTELEEHIKNSDLVITGEGSVDEQSLSGKVPVGIANIASKYNVPVVAFAGKISGEADVFINRGIDLIIPIVDEAMTLDQAMVNGSELIYKAAKRFMQTLKLSKVIYKEGEER